MFTIIAIGNIGAAADYHNENGSEFISFRIAHNDRWKGQDGVEHSRTTWLDCTMNGKPSVFEYLRPGQLVFVEGSATLRVYSSPKDRCMKAGCTINVRRIELLGGQGDIVPRQLYTSDGVQVDVTKYYHCEQSNVQLMSQRGAQFVVDAQGWVFPISTTQGTDMTSQPGSISAETTDEGQTTSDTQDANETKKRNGKK